MSVSDLLDLMETHRERLLAFIRSRVGCDEDSWDILQDVFMTLVARWNLGEILEDATAWLFRVTRNRIVDLYRRRSRGEISLEVLLDALGNGESAELEDPGADRPEAAQERAELRGRLLRVLRSLPPEQREVLKRTALEGRRFDDLAEETGIPLGTLLARKRYAVLRLRETVRAFEEEGKGKR